MTPVIRLIDDEPTVLDSQSFVLEVAGFQTACYDSAQSFLTTGDTTSPGAVNRGRQKGYKVGHIEN